MTDLDREALTYKLEKIRANVGRLQEFGQLSLEDFRSDDIRVAAAERLLQVAIEAMLDTGNHVIAVKGWEAPQQYRDIFVILGRHGVLQEDQIEKYTKMAGLRNRLVHLYDDIDADLLFEYISSHLGDFTLFVKDVSALL
jgi:uncharacterized protein YutE (UPF0331/DUF86 family)